MTRTGSLFSQILSLFQRPDLARHVRATRAARRRLTIPETGPSRFAKIMAVSGRDFRNCWE